MSVRKFEREISGVLRVLIVALAILLQLSLILLLVYTLSSGVVVYTIVQILALFEMVMLVSRDKNSSYTIAWILVIACLPVFGQILYLMWGRSDVKSKRHDITRASIAYGQQFLPEKNDTYEKLKEEHPSRKRLSSYLASQKFPLYQNTSCRYFELGEYHFDAMLQDMEQAEQFIFLEYFIVAQGKLWDRVFEILKRKAAQGVEIRLMYDDAGSIVTVPKDFISTVSAYNIQVMRYSPIHRYISQLHINYRNHQKIAVIDGHIGYTGGTNLADEYANIYPKHGHWKDTAIRLEGEAVWSLTVFFLQLWDAESGERTDYARYKCNQTAGDEGYFQPFMDGPVNNPENPAEVMYRTIIANAKDYVYITTPYLVIDNTMMALLCSAAQSGVDVRLITPKVWDHWYVHTVSRSNYPELLQAGVKVYEYTPGYIHAKTIISDDDHCITGSINMDYRSFNLHFENGVWICGAPVIKNMKDDILNTFAVCEEMTLEKMEKRPWYIKVAETILRIFAIAF